MAGIIVAGYPLARYLAFPPETMYVLHAPFSWPVFSAYLIFIVCTTGPFIVKGIKAVRANKALPTSVSIFPWWGWLGVLTGFAAWLLAWSRFPWFASLQPHTFTLLWLSFIIVVNALCHKKTGRCMMANRTRFFLLLFPTSALFWWFFEYLNRFVQNWYYTGVHFSPFAYFCYATLSFSTVLPAVLGIRELLLSCSWIQQGFADGPSFRLPLVRLWAWAALVVSGIGLAGIGVWPDYFFALLWISPLLIITSMQSLTGDDHILSGIAKGDWRNIVSSAMAALVCGVFWEMWNYYSLAKWQYRVPFVDRFHIFAMPLLGYAGYLPFGLECAMVAMLLERLLKSPSDVA